MAAEKKHSISFRYFAVLLLFISQPVVLQVRGQGNEYFSAGVSGHYGSIIPHSAKIRDFGGTHLAGLTADFRKINVSREKWEVFNSFWFWGAEAGYYNFSKPDVLGSSVSLALFAEPVLDHGRNHLLTLRGGIGPAIQTRLYDSISNPTNLFFSTNLAFILHISGRFSYRINDGLFLNISGNYNHISNGGVRQPNLGMNFPTISAGVLFYSRSFPEFSGDFRNEIVKRPGLAWTIQTLAGYRVVGATDDYPEKGSLALGLNLRSSKQLTRYYGLNAGGEIILDGAVRETIRRQGTGIDYKRAAVTIGQEFLFGDAIFSQYFGIYVYSPYKARNSTYQKYELSYRISRKLLAGFYLKAHSYIAELMGIQVGVTM